MFLLVLKTTLEGLTQRVPPEEIFTFTKFLLLTAVILPVLPRAEFTQFQINPFKTWLVVVAVSSVSYGSYLLLKVTHGRNGVLLSALLGGAYSSTVTTIALARRSAPPAPGGIVGVIACFQHPSNSLNGAANVGLPSRKRMGQFRRFPAA